MAITDGCVTYRLLLLLLLSSVLASLLQQYGDLAGCVSDFPPVDNEVKVGWRLGVHTSGKQARGIKPAAF